MDSLGWHSERGEEFYWGDCQELCQLAMFEFVFQNGAGCGLR